MDRFGLLLDVFSILIPTLALIIEWLKNKQGYSVGFEGCILEKHYSEYRLLTRFWMVFYISGFLVYIFRFYAVFPTIEVATYIARVSYISISITLFSIVLLSKIRKIHDNFVKGLNNILDFLYVEFCLIAIICIASYAVFNKKFPEVNPDSVIILSFIGNAIFISSSLFLFYANYYRINYIRKAEVITVILNDGSVLENIKEFTEGGRYYVITINDGRNFQKYIVNKNNISYVKKIFT